MTGLLLDTNVVSELRKSSDRMNPGVRAWAANLDSTTAYLSAITISELSQWVVATQRRDPAQGDLLDRWFHSKVLSHYKEHIIPVDTAVALVAGSLHVPNPKSNSPVHKTVWFCRKECLVLSSHLGECRSCKNSDRVLNRYVL